jgi:hypothetical protein
MLKEHLLAELNASFKELDKYKQNNPNLFNYLPIELKNIVAMAQDMLLPANVETKGTVEKEKPKNKCQEMKDKWDDMIDNFLKDAKSNLEKGGDQQSLEKLAENYYQKYSNKSWFDDKKKKSNAINYIKVSTINREITFKRIVFPNNDGSSMPFSEQGPLSTGAQSRGSHFIGLDQKAEIEVPQSGKKNTYILGGTYSYELDCLTEPDTFIISDALREIEPVSNVRGVHINIGNITDIQGNLFIDVQESAFTSQWTAIIKLSFLQVRFLIPECNPNDTPCPKWKKNKKK